MTAPVIDKEVMSLQWMYFSTNCLSLLVYNKLNYLIKYTAPLTAKLFSSLQDDDDDDACCLLFGSQIVFQILSLLPLVY